MPVPFFIAHQNTASFMTPSLDSAARRISLHSELSAALGARGSSPGHFPPCSLVLFLSALRDLRCAAKTTSFPRTSLQGTVLPRTTQRPIVMSPAGHYPLIRGPPQPPGQVGGGLAHILEFRQTYKLGDPSVCTHEKKEAPETKSPQCQM